MAKTYDLTINLDEVVFDLETGEGIPTLDTALEEVAKIVEETKSSVSFIITVDYVEAVEEDDPDARREQQRDDKRDFADEPNED